MKKILLSLFGIITIGLVNFGYCETVNFQLDGFIQCLNDLDCKLDTNGVFAFFGYNNFGFMSSPFISCQDNGSFIDGLDSWGDYDLYVNIEQYSNGSNFGNTTLYIHDDMSVHGDFYFPSGNNLYVLNIASSTDLPYSIFSGVMMGRIRLSCSYSTDYFSGWDNVGLYPLNSLISSTVINSGYCENNNLCPISTGNSGECSTGDIQRSSLYINDIQHSSASVIDITIPEEISWDYVNENDEFILDVNGYNQDSEYIDNIIRLQNYKPSSDDFTGLVSTLAPYSKILIFCVFIFIIWAWIKKPFKSKKF